MPPPNSSEEAAELQREWRDEVRQSFREIRDRLGTIEKWQSRMMGAVAIITFVITIVAEWAAGFFHAKP